MNAVKKFSSLKLIPFVMTYVVYFIDYECLQIKARQFRVVQAKDKDIIDNYIIEDKIHKHPVEYSLSSLNDNATHNSFTRGIPIPHSGVAKDKFLRLRIDR